MDAFDLRLWKGFIAAGGNPSFSAIIDQVVIDSRRVDSNCALFASLPGEHSDGHHYIEEAIDNGAKVILVKKNWHSSSIPKHVTVLKVENPLYALQEIAQSYRKQLPTTIIAIGGSHGKTMVKDLLETIASQSKQVAASPESFNSQIGVTLSLFTISKQHDLAFIEAGISEQKEMARLAAMINPDATIITHIGKKHLTTLGDRQIMTTEFISLIKPNNLWSLIPEDPLIMPLMKSSPIPSHFWNQLNKNLPQASFLIAESLNEIPYKIIFPNQKSYTNKATQGFFYFLDLINIAIKAAWLLGLSSEAISKALSQYTIEPMRTEIWTSSSGVTFINDLYCSDPQSIDKSLHYFNHTPPYNKKFFIFNGMRGVKKHTENSYRRIGKAISKSKLDFLYLVGDYNYNSLKEEILISSPQTKIFSFKGKKEAFQNMIPHLNSGDYVLIKGNKKVPLDVITEAFEDSVLTNRCFINFAAIEDNISVIRKKTPAGTRIMVMVKALGYGTNDIQIGRFLETCGINILGVSYVEEGVRLKRSGITQDVFVLNASSYEANKVVKWGLEVAISEQNTLLALAEEAEKQQKIIKIHLHLNTGMGRFGCTLEELKNLVDKIHSSPFLKLEGIMSHLSSSDDPSQDDFSFLQIKKMNEAIKDLEETGIKFPWKHIANSSATIRFELSEFNMIRVGLAVFGLYTSQAVKNQIDLKLAISLLSRVVGISTYKKGESISYGRTYLVEREEEKIAVIPIGYFDGLHRNYSGKSSVLINGKKAPMVGRICMDFMMVNVTDIPNVSLGDNVLIFGEDEYGNYLSAEELAESGNSIVHELITCLGPRIPRIFIYEDCHRLNNKLM